MTRAATRILVGLWMLLVVAVVAAPLVSPAAAQGRDQLPAAGAGDRTLPTATVPRITTTTASTVPTTPPSSSTVSTTPVPTTAPRTATTRARGGATTTTTTPPPTTTTSTTLAPLPAAAPPPVTLPFASTVESGNISSFFPVMSGIGIFALICLLAAQWFLTSPGRRGPTL
jgi:hypothetical protein